MFSLECGDPKKIEYAYSNHANTSIVEYKCYEQYYKLIGDPVINCLENGSWATQNFTCKEVLTKMHPWDLKRPTDKNENTKTIIITSILVIIFIIIVILVIIYLVKRNRISNDPNYQVDDNANESVDVLSKENQNICGRKFPANIVKNWSDITIHKEVGKGSFGKVYQAYLHLNEVQR